MLGSTIRPGQGRSHRSLPLEPPLVAALAAHREYQSQRAATLGDAWADDNLIFTSEVGTPINARNLARQFKRLIEKAGVRDIPIHSVRHSVATFLVSSGEDLRTVADYLGHDPRVLVSTYAHVVAHRKVEVARRLGVLLPPGDGASS